MHLENSTIEKNETESLTKSAFGFWLSILSLLALTQVVRIFILQNQFPTFFNDKFAFSLAIPNFISYAVYAIVFFLIIKYLYSHWTTIAFKIRLGLALILCGGIANLIERLWNGYVVDYIFILNGVLNLADLYIITGIILLLVYRPALK